MHLADRVRENLLMDSGTFVRGAVVTPGPQASPDADGPESAPVSVGFVVRAQRNGDPV